MIEDIINYDNKALYELKHLRKILDRIITAIEGGQTFHSVVIKFSVIDVAFEIYKYIILARGH